MVPILGVNNPAGMPGIAYHVGDIAFVHVASLDPKIEGNRNFGVNYSVNGIQWDDALAIIENHLPQAVKKGISTRRKSNCTTDVTLCKQNLGGLSYQVQEF